VETSRIGKVFVLSRLDDGKSMAQARRQQLKDTLKRPLPSVPSACEQRVMILLLARPVWLDDNPYKWIMKSFFGSICYNFSIPFRSSSSRSLDHRQAPTETHALCHFRRFVTRNVFSHLLEVVIGWTATRQHKKVVSPKKLRSRKSFTFKSSLFCLSKFIFVEDSARPQEKQQQQQQL